MNYKGIITTALLLDIINLIILAIVIYKRDNSSIKRKEASSIALCILFSTIPVINILMTTKYATNLNKNKYNW